MPKSKQQKQETIKSLEDGLKAAKAVVFANFQGLKVSEAEELRRECRKNDIKVVAAKKTLVKRACEDLGLKDIDPNDPGININGIINIAGGKNAWLKRLGE